ncbi:hypothetical protein GCK32_016857 [Trichostrongylus colubriformis]|uniref:Uncharacterized protein n=1 Tax=Trichostrongylus colubriformis TaxID=6319 RepID=A0AAN8FDU0_TRICO
MPEAEQAGATLKEGKLQEMQVHPGEENAVSEPMADAEQPSQNPRDQGGNAAELRRGSTASNDQRRSGRPSPRYLEIARLYKVSRTVKRDIKRMEDAMKRFQERRRGPFFVAGEPHLQGGNVPVNQVREYWKPIVGEARPFTKTVELVTWSRTQRPSGGTLVDPDLPKNDWKTLFYRIKPWKATGPDGVQGFWWKHLPVANEWLKAWCIKVLRRLRE